ncbi:MAG: DUF2341 domain-containing protein, partial [Planctomycetaceae bacterium]|nr:DUF2341 domain-containing protein [Planctomycetaceae bacterium]
NWLRREKLVFDNTGQATNLTDFAVLVTLDGNRIDYSFTQDSGQDLRFVDGDGSVLAHEIETWDENGTSTVWVHIPRIDAGSGTDFIHMYYGNAAAADGQNATAVWNSNYALVQHLEEGSGTLTDSTANGNDATNSNANLNAPGYISGGGSFNGTNSKLTVSDSASLDITSALTISGWINASSLDSYHPIVAKGSSSSSMNYYFATNSSGNGLQFEYTSGTVKAFNTGDLGLTTGTWYHVGVTYDDATNTVSVYLNGSQVYTNTSATSPMLANNGNLTIGTGPYAGEWFDGLLDEIRVENTARSTDWFTAQYLSMNNSLITFSGTESVPAGGGVLDNDSDPDGDVITAVLVSGPSNAQQFTLNADGSFTYRPNDGYSGVDSFTYRAFDGSLSSGVTTVTLTVGSVNNPPRITSDGGGGTANVAIAENTTAVTTVMSTDTDGGTPAYSISGGADAAAFTINASTGVLSLATAPDFETPSDDGLNNVYEVTVQVSDGNGGNDSQTIIVTVSDVDEFDVSAPIDTDGAGNSVDENSANGVAVGIVAFASDGDGTTNAVLYSLTDDAGGRFAIDSTTGVVTVANGLLLDREAAASHTITVRATSADGSTSDTAFTINVNDVDEFDVSAPADSDATANAVNENAANGTTVGVTASASDDDATTNGVTYLLVDDAGGRFTIDGTTGVVTVANGTLLDRETTASHNITVRATSVDGSTNDAVFTISINDVDESGVSALSDTDATLNTVAENGANGTTVGVTAFAS